MKEKIDVFVRLKDRNGTRVEKFLGTIVKEPSEKIDINNIVEISFRENTSGQ
jgi:hypothetical protein